MKLHLRIPAIARFFPMPPTATRRIPLVVWVLSSAILLAAPQLAPAAETTSAKSKSARALNEANPSVPSTIPSPEDLKSSIADGPNGPIPAIVVDQFGYPTPARKIAVIRDPQTGFDSSSRFTPGQQIVLVNVKTGSVVKSGAPVPWNGGTTDPASGDRAWWFDFSDVNRPGRYVVVDIDRKIRSFAFDIGDDVYRNVLKRAVKTFFYQRAGYEKTAEYAGAAWADAASHMGANQDPYSKPWPGAAASFPPDSSGVRDLRGGWYDAGDFNKYTTWAARDIIVLLDAYEENPHAFGDDFGIPESNNGIPDLLDEVKWSLDWLIRMQVPNGSVLCIQSLAFGSPPSAAKEPSFYGPPTTSASLMAAAAFARASKIYGTQPGMKEYAADLVARAKAAWTWALANPSVLYWNNDEARQPGSKGLGAGQQELRDQDRALAKFEAAANLYAATGDPSLKQFAEANFASMVPKYGPTLWEVDGQDAVLRFSKSDGLSPETAKTIQLAFLGALANQTFHYDSELNKTAAYRAYLRDYTWGSNKAMAMQARLFQLIASYTNNDPVRRAAQAAALEYVHYIHGVNPLGLVYLTNMAANGATHSASTMFHAWFAEGTQWEKVGDGKPGPAPGFLVGGPNPSYSIDSCCLASRTPGQPLCYGPEAEKVCKQNFSPPAGQPPAKSYLQFNKGWPANSWAVTEPSNSYQVYYIRMLASFVR